jgi:hypothetical protein
MEQLAKEITREYRVDFNKGETEWNDPIPPEVTSDVLGNRTTCVISRTSLLAWSLMRLPHVEVADLARGGWIKVRLNTDEEFDEVSFKLEVAELIASIREVRPHKAKGLPGFLSPPRLRNAAAALMSGIEFRPT